MAYRRGEDSDQALIGALLEAESYRAQRVVAAFLEGLAKRGRP
jgi:hypothetical protein